MNHIEQNRANASEWTAPCEDNQYHSRHIALLANSYRQLLGQPLLEAESELELARRLFEADFALLSHSADADPLFTYANRTALKLFEYRWDELIGIPSRYSAEPAKSEERERLLAKVERNGYIDDYSGVRIAKSGRRFVIQQTVVWNIYDDQQRYYGQAACIPSWSLLP